MDHTVRRALTGDPDRPTLTVERVYRASPADVRAACASVDRLARWFGEVRGGPAGVGDTFSVALGEDPDDRAAGRVTRCEDDVIAVTWTWQGEPESVVTVRVAAVDGGRTRLTLRHELAEADHAVGYGGGWEQMLQALSRTLGEVSDDAPSDERVEAEAIARWRTITRAPLTVERVVPAAVEDVWTAFATAEGLRSWWWRHWSDVRIEADVREAGTYRIRAPGAGIDLSGRYLAVGSPGHLACTWRWHDADGAAPDEAVDLRLEPVAGGTRVIVRHTGPWADDAPGEAYREGWTFTLDQLAASLGAGSGPDGDPPGAPGDAIADVVDDVDDGART